MLFLSARLIFSFNICSMIRLYFIFSNKKRFYIW
nr:MAG TPA: hypothetical protein [Caudoviricetes sp.]